MHAEKVSIPLPESPVRFVEHYRVLHHGKTHFEEALGLLRARELEEAYREADQEADTAASDAVTADGLADETWLDRLTLETLKRVEGAIRLHWP